jgi:glutamate synthase (NADPH/NADH) small chain
MPALADEIEAVLAEGVRIELLRAPQRVLTDRQGHVRALELLHVQLGEPDRSGRREPHPVAGSEHVVAADSLILALGEVADLSLLRGTGVATNGRIDVAFTGATNEPDLFACGDAAFGHGTVTQAIASGRRAANAVVSYLSKQGVHI